MKRIVFSLVLFFGFAASVSAQEPTAERIKPAGGDFGLGFKITGLSNINFSEWDNDHFAIPQLLGRYYISDKFALRGRLGLDMKNVSSRYAYRDPEDQPINSIISDTLIDTKNTNTSLSFFPGIEYHLASPATKIDPYIGFEAGISYMGATTDIVTTKVKKYDKSNNSQQTLDYFVTNTHVTPGGIGFGGNLILGFNYFFSDNFALGAEYTLGTVYTAIGGNVKHTTTGYINYPQNTSLNDPQDYSHEYEMLDYNMSTKVRSTGGVNISVFW